MELRGGQEGEVVPTVGDRGAPQNQAVPEAGGGQVGAQDHGSHHHRQHVGDLAINQSDLISFALFIQTIQHKVLHRVKAISINYEGT